MGWGSAGRPWSFVGWAGGDPAGREFLHGARARSQCAPLDGRQAGGQAGRPAGHVSLGPACRDVTLSILAPPPPPSKHPLSVEGTAQGFLRGHWLLNERPD